jgi:hypothetical protein
MSCSNSGDAPIGSSTQMRALKGACGAKSDHFADHRAETMLEQNQLSGLLSSALRIIDCRRLDRATINWLIVLIVTGAKRLAEPVPEHR